MTPLTSAASSLGVENELNFERFCNVFASTASFFRGLSMSGAETRRDVFDQLSWSSYDADIVT